MNEATGRTEEEEKEALLDFCVEIGLSRRRMARAYSLDELREFVERCKRVMYSDDFMVEEEGAVIVDPNQMELGL